jgi:hypothetical protein
MSGFPAFPLSANLNASHHRLPVHVCLFVMLLGCTSLMPALGYAQDGPFLECADLIDRDARLSCLETALEAAIKQRDAANASQYRIEAATPAVQSTTSPVAPATAPANVTSSNATSSNVTAGNVTAANVTAADDSAADDSAATEPRNFNLFGWLNREHDEQPAEPVETMQARVADLEYFKPDVWTITLDNGQVWRQMYVRRFNLREGDAIRIYSTGWGQQYRLEAERFNGYIQVERVR